MRRRATSLRSDIYLVWVVEIAQRDYNELVRPRAVM